MTKIIIKHTGEDYVGVEYNNEYYEVTLTEGKIIKQALAIVKAIIDQYAK